MIIKNCQNKNRPADKILNKFGFLKSKLEKWIEDKLKKIYPKLKIEYNNKKICDGLELDIYIPKLSLAFELNGIFHYEPIFGKKDLINRKKRDKNKMIKCAEKEIDLCVIDTSSQHYFKETTSQKFLDIIINIIKERI